MSLYATGIIRIISGIIIAMSVLTGMSAVVGPGGRPRLTSSLATFQDHG